MSPEARLVRKLGLHKAAAHLRVGNKKLSAALIARGEYGVVTGESRRDIDTRRVENLYAACGSVRVVARRLRCSPQTVCNRLAKRGVPRSRARKLSVKAVHRAIVMRRDGFKLAEIARAMGVTRQAISWRLKRGV